MAMLRARPVTLAERLRLLVVLLPVVTAMVVTVLVVAVRELVASHLQQRDDEWWDLIR